MAALLRNDCGAAMSWSSAATRPMPGARRQLRDAGIATFAISHRDYANREAFDAALVTALNQFQPDLVVLAGFMRILTPVFVRRTFCWSVDQYPSVLLPSFPGSTPTSARWPMASSCTAARVHFVTPLDRGPIIAQAGGAGGR